jgi:ribosomal protein S18 acetylase RimI-like enzyme
MIIRKYSADDLPQIRQLVAELHEYVKPFDKHMPEATDIIEPYFNYLLKRVNETDGTIHVAESNNVLAGCCVQFGRVLNDEPDELPFYYSYITDLVVSENFRNQQIGQQLLNNAVEYANTKNVEHIELSAFYDNTGAVDFYLNNGFKHRVITLRKELK